jgi:hypothetical protein
MKKLILAFISIFFLGLLIGYIPTLASPSPGAPNPGHTASEIGGTSDAERTFNSTGKYTFLGNLDVRGGLTVSGTVSASTFKTRNQACPSGWACEVNTWDIAAQSIRAYGHIIATGLGSFNGAEQWNNFVTSKTGYGDTIGIGGDNAGDDVEIRINAPSARNKVVFWNSNVNSFANMVANNADFTGNLNVNGYVKIGGAKLTYASGNNPSCPSGYMFLSKHYYGSCGGDARCSGCTVNKWDTNPPSCQWLSWCNAVGQCCGSNWCSVSDWTEALCIGS